MRASETARQFMAFARREGIRLDLGNLRSAAARFHAVQVTEGADGFRAMACPQCGAPLASWSRNGAWKCRDGHRSNALRSVTAPRSAARPVPPAPRLSSAGVGDLWVSGPIEADTHRQVAERLAALRAASAKAVLMTVDSPGGHVEAALAIHDDLRALGIPVVAYVERAHSAASVIALGAEHLVMDPDGTMLLHRVSGGTGPEQRRSYDAQLALIYSKASPGEDGAHVVSMLLGGDNVFGSVSALQWGYVDELGSTVRALAVASAYAEGRPPFSARRAALAAWRS